MRLDSRSSLRWFLPVVVGACVWLGGCGDDEDEVDAAPIIDASAADAAIVDAATVDAATVDAGTDGPPSSVMIVDCASVTPAETVVMDNLAYDPPEVTIAVGDAVMFTNNDGVMHTVTSGNPDDSDAGALFDTEEIPMGESRCLSFSSMGDFEYFCEVHPVMMQDGVVHVIMVP